MIERYERFTSRLPEVSFRLFIVNDGSQQGISERALERLHSAIPDLNWISYTTNRGKGHALREGLRKTSAPLVVYTDIDLPYTIDSMVSIVDDLRNNNADLAVGIRDAGYYQKIPRSRRWISKLLRGLNRVAFGLRIADTQCGLKGMNTRGRQLFLETTIDRYLFDLELVMQASRNRSITLRAVPVYLEPGVQLSPVQSGLLLREMKNLGRLFVKRWF